MKILDTLLGRTKPVKPNLDALFALPAAAITLQVSAGLVPSGRAGVCFKPPAGQPFADMQAEIERLLELPEDTNDSIGAPTPSGASSGASTSIGTSTSTNAHVSDVGDSYGYHWILLEGSGIDDLVTRAHVVHSSIEDAGWGPQLLCSVFGFGEGDDVAASTSVYLVYLAKRGTFYPFAPTGKEQRDTELELRLRSIVGSDLPIEQDLTRWFPLWDIPI